MKKLKHLSEIYNLYDAFIIDLWGVMHNGIKLYPNAMEVVENLKILWHRESKVSKNSTYGITLNVIQSNLFW